MSHTLCTPTAARSGRRFSRYAMAFASAAFVAGVAALPAAAATAPAARPSVTDVRPAAEPCPPGYVWRDMWDGDTLCVTPEERDAAR
ncbi:hypothetical protein [Streptomyces sp. NPDC091371]|uniref:hypothetical protein n=1 Tax=Streptomyces sp. NPDC091371 TaxID=3155303 RepID=UPI003425E020